MADSDRNHHAPGTWREVLLVFTRLGLTSFGGPVAHLGYFRNEFVIRRCWLDDRSFADLVALCQFLPGPVSSQVGIAVGLTRAGYAGALAAWVGFTLPSALAMILFGYGIAAFGDGAGAGRARHGAHARARSRPRHARRARGGSRARRALLAGPDRRHHPRRRDRPRAAARRGHGANRCAAIDR